MLADMIVFYHILVAICLLRVLEQQVDTWLIKIVRNIGHTGNLKKKQKQKKKQEHGNCKNHFQVLSGGEREWGIRPTFCYDTTYERMGQRSHAVSSFVHMSPTKPPQHRLLWHMTRVDNRDSPCDRIWTIILFTRLTAFVGKPNESYKDERIRTLHLKSKCRKNVLSFCFLNCPDMTKSKQSLFKLAKSSV